MSDLAQNSIEILTSLADGYNRYYSADKIKCYTRARTSLCRTQSLLLLAASLSFIDTEPAKKLFIQYEEKISMFNGLIKLFEEKR